MGINNKARRKMKKKKKNRVMSKRSKKAVEAVQDDTIYMGYSPGDDVDEDDIVTFNIKAMTMEDFTIMGGSTGLLLQMLLKEMDTNNIVRMVQREMAEAIGKSENTVSSAMSKLRSLNTIENISNGVYRINPEKYSKGS